MRHFGVTAAETSFDQKLEYIFDEYLDKLSDEVEEILENRRRKNPCEIFLDCLHRNEINAAMYHFQRADAESMRFFFQIQKLHGIRVCNISNT